MFDVFGALKKVAKLSAINIDNTAFQLHYKATFIILLAFSVAITSRQYFGDPIHCLNPSDPDTFSQKVLDSYCWIHSTFTLPKAHAMKLGVEIPHPGIARSQPGDKRVYHAYYQWVCFVLFLQALSFYLPRFMWKVWEGGKIQQMTMKLNNPISSSPDETKKQMDILVQYLKVNMSNHNVYVGHYIFCEVLNFVNVIFQIFFVDKFLGGEFTSYGTKVIDFLQADSETRIDPMSFIFPRVTKCQFHRFGPSGDITKLDAMCVLPLNILNEKIYIIVWFWFIILGICSALAIIYRVATMFLPRMRFLLLKSKARLTPPEYLEAVLRRVSFSDWFVLYMLAKNVDQHNYCEVIKSVLDRLLPNDQKVPEKVALIDESVA